MKKEILAAGAIVAGVLGMGDTVDVLKKQAATIPPQKQEATIVIGDRQAGNDTSYILSKPKGGIPFYAHLQFKKTKWGKVTVKKIKG